MQDRMRGFSPAVAKMLAPARQRAQAQAPGAPACPSNRRAAEPWACYAGAVCRGGAKGDALPKSEMRNRRRSSSAQQPPRTTTSAPCADWTPEDCRFHAAHPPPGAPTPNACAVPQCCSSTSRALARRPRRRHAGEATQGASGHLGLERRLGSSTCRPGRSNPTRAPQLVGAACVLQGHSGCRSRRRRRRRAACAAREKSKSGARQTRMP